MIGARLLVQRRRQGLGGIAHNTADKGEREHIPQPLPSQLCRGIVTQTLLPECRLHGTSRRDVANDKHQEMS